MSKAERSEMRNAIGSFDVEPTAITSDNLAIVLCTYFERHPDRPKPDPEDESGWGQWVVQQTNRVLDELTDFVIGRGRPVRLPHAHGDGYEKAEPLTYETFWQRVRETGWNPSPNELRKLLLEAEAKR